MRLSTAAYLASLAALLPSVIGAPSSEPADPLLIKREDDAAAQLTELQQQALNTTLTELEAEEAAMKKRGITPSCTIRNLQIRREFGSMAKADRKAYTDAVKCLQSKPNKTPASVSSGARTRFDDFIVTHIQQTPFIHYSGTFLGWHRYYLHVYEEALRTECGYKGAIPYWDWPKYANAPQNSPIFNGDAYSMGGNGKFIPGHEGVTLLPAFDGLGSEPIYLAAGLGGGCVEKGPFKDLIVNLGPIGLANSTTGPEGGLGHNPRCLQRDVGPGVAKKYTNYVEVLKAMLKPDIATFQLNLQGTPGENTIGVHGGGHYTIGGDPGGDLFTSPGDPAFYLHHGQVDRLWTMWQALDPVRRTFALAGTNTLLNMPPSEDTTLDFTINTGYSGGETVAMRDIMSTTKGPFCYIYL